MTCRSAGLNNFDWNLFANSFDLNVNCILLNDERLHTIQNVNIDCFYSFYYNSCP